MNKTVIDASYVIQMLGGTAKTAALCDVTPSAVSQWIKNGIPKAQRNYIAAIRPDIFGVGAEPRRRRSDK